MTKTIYYPDEFESDEALEAEVVRVNDELKSLWKRGRTLSVRDDSYDVECRKINEKVSEMLARLDELGCPYEEESHACQYTGPHPSNDYVGGGFPYLICEECGDVRSLSERDDDSDCD